MTRTGLLIFLAVCVAIGALFACSGCTDAGWKNATTLGKPGHVVCYSGGKVIYDGWSTGKIVTESDSDGWRFVDRKTDKLVRVSGDCVIEN